MAEQIRANQAVAIHVRYFDMPDSPSVNNLPVDYYHHAISILEARYPAAHYFLFCEQPDAALSMLRLPSGRYTVVDINSGDDMAYADLWLMSQCQHFIIANSTFSWWGAWLGSYSDKYVIAPSFDITDNKNKITSWGFKGLLPNSWNDIPVTLTKSMPTAG